MGMQVSRFTFLFTSATFLADSLSTKGTGASVHNAYPAKSPGTLASVSYSATSMSAAVSPVLVSTSERPTAPMLVD